MKRICLIIWLIVSALSGSLGQSWTNLGPFEKIKSFDGTIDAGHAFVFQIQSINRGAVGSVDSVFVSTGAGLFKSTDGGNSFQNIMAQNLPLKIHAHDNHKAPFYVQSNKSNTILNVSHWAYFSGQPAAVHLTSDGGVTWNTVPWGAAPVTQHLIFRDLKAVRSAPHIVYAATSAGLFKLDLNNPNNGWTRDVADVNHALNNQLLIKIEVSYVSSTNYSIFAQTASGHIYRKNVRGTTTTDWYALSTSGLTDLPVFGTIPAEGTYNCSMAASSNSTLFFIQEKNNNNGNDQVNLSGTIYKFNFATKVWSLLPSSSYTSGLGYGGSILGSKTHPLDSNKVFISHEILRIYEVGKTEPLVEAPYQYTWACGSWHADISGMDFSPVNTSRLYCANDGFVSRYNVNSTNAISCPNWTNLECSGLSGLDVTSVSSAIDKPDAAVLSTWHNPGMYYDGSRSGEGKYRTIPGTHESYGSFFYYSKDKFFTYYYNKVNSIKFNVINSNTVSAAPFALKTAQIPQGKAIYGTMGNKFVRDVNNPYTIFIGQDQVYKSVYINSASDNLFKEVTDFPSGENVTHIATSFLNPSNIFVATWNGSEAKIYKVKHESSTFDVVLLSTLTGKGSVFSFAVNSTDEQNIICCFDKTALWETQDGGGTWVQINGTSTLTSPQFYSVEAEKGTNGRFIVSGYHGVQYRENGTSWMNYGSLPGVQMFGLDINYAYNCLYAAGCQAGLWKASLKCPTVVNNNLNGSLESRYWEGQNVTISNATYPSANIMQVRGSNSITLLPNSVFQASTGGHAHFFVHGCNPTDVSSTSFYRTEEVKEVSATNESGAEVEYSFDNLKDGIVISPNPSNGPIKINSELSKGEVFNYLKIADVNGVIVYETTKYQPEIQINLSSTMGNVFMVRFVTDRKKVTRKVICNINGVDPDRK